MSYFAKKMIVFNLIFVFLLSGCSSDVNNTDKIIEQEKMVAAQLKKSIEDGLLNNFENITSDMLEISCSCKYNYITVYVVIHDLFHNKISYAEHLQAGDYIFQETKRSVENTELADYYVVNCKNDDSDDANWYQNVLYSNYDRRKDRLYQNDDGEYEKDFGVSEEDYTIDPWYMEITTKNPSDKFGDIIYNDATDLVCLSPGIQDCEFLTKFPNLHSLTIYPVCAENDYNKIEKFTNEVKLYIPEDCEINLKFSNF